MEPKKKIFIIDDDSFLLDMYALKFSQSNFDVTTALGSEPALEKLKSGFVPDVMLLDIVMPVMDGFQFLEEFEKLPDSVHQKVKIIMLSSSISPRDIDRAASNRFVIKYLNKPLNSRYLQAIG